MLKIIFVNFLPWILFSIFTSYSENLEVSIGIALASCLLFDYSALKRGFILSWGTLIFFSLMLVAIIYFKNLIFIQYYGLLLIAALTIIVWFSIFIGKPFTLQYAKQQVDQDKWEHPLFLKINYELTYVWGFIFLSNLFFHIVQIYYPAAYGEVIFYFLNFLGMGFSAWYPKYRVKQA